MKTIALTGMFLMAMVGCHSQAKTSAPSAAVAAPIEHPENAEVCNDVYYHVVGLKVLELGVPTNDDGTFDEEGTKREAYRIDQEFRRRGTASWFFNQCLTFNRAQLLCMQRAASIPLLNTCETLFAE